MRIDRAQAVAAAWVRGRDFGGLPVVGAFVNYQVTFAVVVLAYLLSGPVLWVRNRTLA